MDESDIPILQDLPEAWAFSLENTEHLKWAENSNRIRYNWNTLELPQNISTQVETSIIVGRRYPNKSIQEVRRITKGIRKIPKIEVGTPILGIIDGNRVKRAGFVSENYSKDNQRREGYLDIAWGYEFNTELTRQSVLDIKAGFQRLTKSKVEKLKLSQQDIINKEGTELRSVLYQIQKRWLDKYRIDQRLDDRNIEGLFFKIIDTPKDKGSNKKMVSYSVRGPSPKQDPGGFVTLFYGTNRKKTGEKDINKIYGSSVSELKTGFCKVSIPKGHKAGKIERPSIFKLSFKENSKSHIVLKNIFECSIDEFYQVINDAVRKSEDKSGLIFIHGYNNSFSESAWRTAQIVHDLPFNGISGFFSWPSNGSFEDYLGDIEKADASNSLFESFLTTFLERTEVESVHLIAHSMGSRVLTSVIKDLEKNQRDGAFLNKIQQLVLAAPDLDQEVFRNEIEPYFKKLGLRRTLYASDKDLAILGSERLRGSPRLGKGGEHLFVSDDIDTIDASNVPVKGLFKHGYLFETNELLTDLFLLLNSNLNPESRRLRARVKNMLPYWLFPQ